VLLCYVTAGSGHRRAAEAIATALRELDATLHVDCLDLLGFTPSWLRFGYPASYEWLIRHAAGSWALGFHGLDQPAVFDTIRPWRRRWNLAMARRFIESLRQQPPAVIVTTHFFPADVCAALRETGVVPSRLVVVVTDLFPHRFWLNAHADAIVVGSELTRSLCIERGMPADRLHALGIPVDPRFVPSRDRAAGRTALGLDPSRRTILLAGGGMGVGPIREVALALRRSPHELIRRAQVVVVCGDNAALTDELRAAAQDAPMPIHVFGFVETMPQLMQASDVLVTKAGGLTVTEALAVGLPMVLCGNIPGQEQANAQFLLEQGAALNAANPQHAVGILERLLEQPMEMIQLSERAHAASRPEAAKAIARDVILPMLEGTGI